MNNLLTLLSQRLDAGERVVEAAVLGNDGSAPRTTGAAMLIFKNGGTAGTIGGGRLEAEVELAARELFAQAPGTIRFLSFNLSNADAAHSDMICGGRQDLVLLLHTPDSLNHELFHWASEELEQGRDIIRLFDLGSELDETPHVAQRWGLSTAFVPPDLSKDQAKLAMEAKLAGGARRFCLDGRAYLALAQIQPGTLILYGAGHVAQQTATAASFVGFRVVVLDDRPEYANRERFPQAEHIVVLPSFDAIPPDTVPIDSNSYLVIVTRGHQHDKTVLGQILNSQAAYIGMIGSTRKRDAIYGLLRKEGASDDALARVYSPIGLAIGAETPEEIAISIVGELIRARALRRGTRKRV